MTSLSEFLQQAREVGANMMPTYTLALFYLQSSEMLSSGWKPRFEERKIWGFFLLTIASTKLYPASP